MFLGKYGFDTQEMVENLSTRDLVVHFVHTAAWGPVAKELSVDTAAFAFLKFQVISLNQPQIL